VTLSVRAHGETHVGKVRDTNEDAVIVDDAIGLFAVLDGMGGAMAGDVAAQRARDVLHEFVRSRRATMEPGPLLEAALNAASAAVHAEAQARRDRKGMGTTAVACLIVDGPASSEGERGKRAFVAHVGDSRAYLLRERRLTSMTRDHTVVAELMAQGAITAQEAETHLYKNVLSRNLGAKPETKVDISEIPLSPGDRILLCSDGLHGFASHDALQYLVGSNEPPEQVAKDLIDAALRGGGGDNVTAVVVEAGAAEVPRSTQILRSSGALAWWARREVFLTSARELGVPRSPICAVLSPDEAIEIVAGNLCEAVFHDLEKSTGVNVWTYAENLAHGWLDQGGGFPALAELLDMLAGAAAAVVADLRGQDAALGTLVDTGVTRALQVADMAIGGVLAERLRTIESELVVAHAERAERAELAREHDEARGRAEAREQGKRDGDDAPRPFTETPTIPWLRVDRIDLDAPAPEIRAALDDAREAARRVVAEGRPLVAPVIDALHRLAVDAEPGTATIAASAVWGARVIEEKGVASLFDAIDHGRGMIAAAVRDAAPHDDVAIATLRRLAAAQAELAIALAHMAIEAAAPSGARLDELARVTAGLRAEVARNEARIAGFERRTAPHLEHGREAP
jgi:PPM family protein phosphatase